MDNQKFQVKVTPTSPFSFVPTDLMISIGEKVTIKVTDPASTSTPPAMIDKQMVEVHTMLSQTIAPGHTITENRMQKLPVSVLSAIDGWDNNKMEPTINTAALNQILAGFNLKLSQ